MYCVNGKPRSSLLIESTDSMIHVHVYVCIYCMMLLGTPELSTHNHSIQQPKLLCSLYLAGILLLGIGYPCTKAYCIHGHIVYHTNSVDICHVGDPCIDQHSGHAYPYTNAEGLFITDANKYISHPLPSLLSHLSPNSL